MEIPRYVKEFKKNGMLTLVALNSKGSSGGIEFQREFRDVKNSIGCSNWRKLKYECVIEEH